MTNLRKFYRRVENSGPSWMSLKKFNRIARENNFIPNKIIKMCNTNIKKYNRNNNG